MSPMLHTILRNTLMIAAAALLAWGCDDSGSRVTLDGSDGDVAGDTVVSGDLTVPQECGMEFPALGCTGNPIGTWELVGLCFETYEDCAGASVTITGSLQGSLEISGDGDFSHDYDLDYEKRISVPQSCLDGGSCGSIGCFGTDTCSCVLGTGSGGGQSGGWMMTEPGRVTIETRDGVMEFCAGDELADLRGGGTRRIWRRVSEKCEDNAACDDGLACTQDYCTSDSGGCANVPVPTGGPEGWLTEPACENGVDDDCDGLVDTDDPDCLTEPCSTAADCTDDGNPCTVTTCDGDGFCRTANAPDAATCPGSDACTDTYICRRDRCVPGPATLDADDDGAVDAACLFGSDCDDGATDVHPGAEGPPGDASCADGVDNDCDGIVDAFDADCWDANCSPEGWCLENPRPTAGRLLDLWVQAADDVWAVGSDGQVLHWDGAGWSRVAELSVFAMAGVCGCAADDGYAVESTGGVFHYDGSTWSRADTPSGGPNGYRAIECLCDDASGTQEVWAVGRSGEYSVFDGSAWSHDVHPSVAADLTDVWVAAPGEAWVVGDGGALSHYVAGAWQDADSGTTLDLHAIWGAAPDRIWAVGDEGAFTIYDGVGSWNTQPSPAGQASLNDLRGIGADDRIWIAGDGVLLDYDPVLEEWSEHDLGSDPPELYAVDGLGTQDAWAVGEMGAMFYIDDQGSPTRDHLTSADFDSICGNQGPGGVERIWAIGSRRDEIFLRAGGGWQEMPVGLDDFMRDMYCAGAHGVFAVGDENWARWGDGVLEGGEVPDIETADWLIAVDGRIGPDGVELVAVGEDGLVARYDGESWTTEYVFDGLTFATLNDVWVSPDPEAAVQAIAVGEGGLYVVFDGTTWTQSDVDSREDFNAVWGDGQGGLWAVGDRGLLAAWNGTALEPLDIGAEDDSLHDVTGTGPDDVWILGDDVVWIFDGTAWSSEPMELATARALHVTSTDAWAVGRNGTILHRSR